MKKINKITEEEVRELLRSRGEEDQMVRFEISDVNEMAWVLLVANCSCVGRLVLDRDEDGHVQVWIHDTADFREIWRRED